MVNDRACYYSFKLLYHASINIHEHFFRLLFLYKRLNVNSKLMSRLFMPQSMSGFCGKLISFVKGKYCGIFFFHMKLFKNWGEMVGVFFSGSFVGRRRRVGGKIMSLLGCLFV